MWLEYEFYHAPSVISFTQCGRLGRFFLIQIVRKFKIGGMPICSYVMINLEQEQQFTVPTVPSRFCHHGTSAKQGFEGDGYCG